jgi:hypothetical protein
MNNVGFGYGLRGLQNLESLGDIENKRRWSEWETRMNERAAEAEGIGNLVGGVLGGAKGYYNKRSDEHDAAHNRELEDWREENLKRQVENAAGEVRHSWDPTYKYTAQAPLPEPEKKPFSILDTIHRDFKDLGWVDD